MTKNDMAYALLVCNVLGLILSGLLGWTSRSLSDTPEGRARILSAVSVIGFSIAGLAKRFHTPWAEQIILGAWIIVLVAQWWKWRDQVTVNRKGVSYVAPRLSTHPDATTPEGSNHE